MSNNCRYRAMKKPMGRAYQKIIFDQHRECRGCTHAASIYSDSDGQPELDWTPHSSEDEGPSGLHPSSESEMDNESEIDNESQVKRDSSTPLGDVEPDDLQSKATAQNSIRETHLLRVPKSMQWK